MPSDYRSSLRAVIGASLAVVVGLVAAGGFVATPAEAALTEAAPATAATVAAATVHPGIPGTDVNYYTGTVDAAQWQTQYANGLRFAIVKTTEGNNVGHAVTSSSDSTNQYPGAAATASMPELYRASLHYANLLKASSGPTQATEFLDAMSAQGASWSANSHTLPPVLDVEKGASIPCYHLTAAQTVAWIAAFSNTIQAKIGVRPIIYTNHDFWSTCTGNSAAFEQNPLFFANYTSASAPVAAIPASWSSFALWQYSKTPGSPSIGDQDVFNGSATQLAVLANGNRSASISAPRNSNATGVGPGHTLGSGQTVHSANLQYSLQMQTDGNLVEKDAGRVIWNSKTAGHAGATLTVQRGGNVVINPKGSTTVLWNTRTAGFANSHLILQSNGDLQVTTKTGVAWRSLAAGTDTLSGITSLTGGQYLHSADGTMQLAMQTDGDLVAYVGGKAVFTTGTAGNPGAHLALQSTGNLVLYSHAGKALWNTHTAGSGTADRLVVAANGAVNLVAGSKVVWSAVESAY